LRVLHETSKGLSEGQMISGRNQQSRLAVQHQFRHTTDSCGHDGTGNRGRFCWHEGKRFHIGADGYDVCGITKDRAYFPLDSQEANSTDEAEFIRKCLQAASLRPVPDDGEIRIDAALRQDLERAKHYVHALQRNQRTNAHNQD
jgi:hypothetical protein